LRIVYCLLLLLLFDGTNIPTFFDSAMGDVKF